MLRAKHRSSGGRRTKYVVDINARPRELIAKAIRNVGGPLSSPGRVIAELSFGFWRYLSSSAHEKTLWVPLLHRAFPPGTGRAAVDGQVGRIYQLRNRAAHHEPLLHEDLVARMEDLRGVAGLLHPELAGHISRTSEVTGLLAVRPR